ncbi:MAG: response regulator [Chroococcales cyanobacterium]
MSKVLVVDDVPTELAMISKVLEDAGFQVVKANDGEEAIASIQDSLPDIVVLDVVMPRMNGFEVIREIRDNQKTKNLPVVFCTQKNTQIDQTWGMELGADAYLSKPFVPEQLLNTIERLVQG